MKTVFVGGGQGCRAVLDLVFQRRLAVLSPEIIGVVDPDHRAPGMMFARAHGLPTFSCLDEALELPGLELVVEVTGLDEVREEIVRKVPRHVRVMDHDMARVFWDLDEIAQSLREDRRQLQEILDSLPDAVMVLDGAGRIERVNRRFEEVTQHSAVEVRGLACWKMLDPSAGAGGEQACGGDSCLRRRVMGTRTTLTVIQGDSCIRGPCPDGDCHYQVTASTIGDSRVVITSREVTEQIRLARETEELARRARQILDAVHGIITITDLEGRYEFVNPSAERFYGKRADELLGRTSREVLPPGLASLIERNDGEVLRQGSRMTSEETVRLGSVESTLITERIVLHDYRGEPVGICRVARNVTESQALQEELVESEKLAAVGKLAAGVAHELNNPLTGILTFSEALLDDVPEGSAMREDLEVIMRETFRCRQIVRDLLDFSRQARPNRQVLSVVPVLQKAIQLVNKQAAFQDIEFHLSLDDGDLRVLADHNQLQQVFLNLIINARDAMDGKGVLRVVSRGDGDAHRVVVDVSDEGSGITPDIRHRIFEPFFSTKGTRGNGLGLAAVAAIVEQHKGEISVESEVGQGTTFRIELPAISSTDVSPLAGA